MKKSIIIFGAVIFLVLSSLTASAVSDPEDDVYHQIVDGSSFKYELFGTRDKVDITDISYSTSGTNITVSLTVKDAIDTSSQNIFYMIYLGAVGATEVDYYYLQYNSVQSIVSSAGVLGGYFDMDPTIDISTDGKTLSYTFTGVDTSNEYEPWGFAAEYFDFTQQGGEGWLDYAPGSYAPWYGMNGDNGGDDNGGGDTGNGDGTGGSTTDNDSPGFGIIALIAGLALLVFVFKKRK